MWPYSDEACLSQSLFKQSFKRFPQVSKTPGSWAKYCSSAKFLRNSALPKITNAHVKIMYTPYKFTCSISVSRTKQT